MDSHTITAVILGIVEGLTEFLPVSSTGHLILATELLGFNAKEWEVFNVVIQLPAILAVVVLYWRTFVDVAHGALRGDRDSLHFVRNVLVAFIPSAILGVLLKKKIDALMETPSVVTAALVVGGVLILVIERLARQGEYEPVSKLPLPKALAVVLAILSLYLIGRNLLAVRARAENQSRPEVPATTMQDKDLHGEERPFTLRHHLRAIAMLAFGAGYVLILPELGYAVSVTLLLAGVAYFLGLRSLPKMALFAVLGGASFFLLFVVVLKIPLPEGVFSDLFRH